MPTPAISRLTRIIGTAFLALLGAGSGYAHIPLSFGIDFLFGGIASFVALRLFGVASGVIVSLAAGAYTLLPWGHPYAMINLGLQTLAVGLLLKRHPNRNLPAWVIAYWAVFGISFITTSYHFALGMSIEAAGMAAVKQAVNEVFNALVATLIVQMLPDDWQTDSEKARVLHIHQFQTNLLAIFAFVPALTLIALYGIRTKGAIDEDLHRTLTSRSDFVAAQVANWQHEYIGALQALAAPGARPDRKSLVLMARAHPSMQYVHLVDMGGNIVDSSIEDRARFSRINYSDRDWFKELVVRGEPVVSDVIVSRTTGKPVIVLAVPVKKDGMLAGMVVTGVEGTTLLNRVAAHAEQSGLRATLVDSRRFIIGSSNPEFAPMRPFDLARGGEIMEREGNIYRWQPDEKTSPMQLWAHSYFAVEHPEGLKGWNLILGQPLAPYAEMMQYSYLIGFSAMFLLALAALGLGSRMSRVVSVPLLNLSEAAAGLSRDIQSKRMQELPHSAIAEIDSLTKDFRHMARALQENYEELDRARDLLETRVLERTAEVREQSRALDEHAIVSITDTDGNITYANDKFVKISGYRREELLGQNHRILKSGLHSQAFYEKIWGAIAHGETWHGELCNRAKDGSLYWVAASIVPFLDKNGRPYQYIAIRTDITQLKKIEQSLRETNQLAESVIENAPVSIFLKRADDLRYVLLNKACEEMLGLSANEVAGRTNYELFPKFQADAMTETDKATIRDGYADIPNQTLITRVGERMLMTRKILLYDNEGAPQYLLGIAHDITEFKRIEAQLISAKEEAERASRAKSEFLSSMSHELRTPMNAILGFGQLLEADETLDAEQHDSINEIMMAGNHLLSLINDVLDLSRIESGRIDFSFEPVEIAPMVRELAQLLMPLAARRDIRIFVEGVSGVVLADYVRLKQSLLNLMSNAVKYNRDKGEVRVSTLAASNGMLRILVEDTGHGIPANRLSELFQPFNRLEAGKSNIEGTGIGLAICRKLVDMMNGDTGVVSELGKGSTFWIELPLTSQPAASSVQSPREILRAPETASLHSVLYIEDNPSNLKLMQHILARRNDVHLRTALHPKVGLELANAYAPDLILLDINLPDLNGYQVLEILKRDEKLKSVPVVAISANAMKSDVEEGLAAGFADYLVKPVNVNTVYRMLDRFLARRDIPKA